MTGYIVTKAGRGLTGEDIVLYYDFVDRAFAVFDTSAGSQITFEVDKAKEVLSYNKLTASIREVDVEPGEFLIFNDI